MIRIQFLKTARILSVALICFAGPVRAQEPRIIPLPREVQIQSGFFVLSPQTRIYYDAPLKNGALYLQQLLKTEHKLLLAVEEKKQTNTILGGIFLTLDQAGAP